MSNIQQSNWTSALGARVTSIIENIGKQKDKKPSNFALILVWFAFNGLLLGIDLLSGVSIALLSMQTHGIIIIALISGVMVMGAGFFPILLAEAMFVRAYASMWQKGISVIVALIGFISTAFYGVMSALLNVLIYTGALDIASGWGLGLEIAVGTTLVLALLTHVILLGTYYFIDDGIRRKQNRQSNLADIETALEQINDSKVIANSAKNVASELEGMSSAELLATSAAFRKITGENMPASELGAKTNPNT